MLKIMVSTGVISVKAMTRGTTRYCTGCTAMAVRASICSVTRMVPSSVATPEPARPDTRSEVSTGDSSRVSDSATVEPTRASAPNSRNA